MTKQFHFNDTKVLVTGPNSTGFYKVELEDKYGGNVVVYERTLFDSLEYAKNWYKQTEKRKKLHDLETNAIKAMIEEDRKRGTMLSLD